MQKIKITNFQALKSVEIEIKDFLILLGEQATGKSTVSKLIYFFKSLKQDFLDQVYDFLDLYLEDHEKFLSLFCQKISRKFYNFFGSTKHLENFEIVYFYKEDPALSLTLHTNESLKAISDSSIFTRLFYDENIKRNIQNVRQYSSQENSFERRSLMRAVTALEELVGEIFNDSLNPLFIPAGRNIAVNYPEQFKLDFYGSLRSDLVKQDARNNGENVTQIGSVQSVDLYLMTQFLQYTGRMLERFESKGFEELLRESQDLSENTNLFALECIIDRIRLVLKGSYIRDRYGEKVYLDDNTYIYLNNASSGQQEAIRILQDAFLILLDNDSAFRVIEEPEAHLYPMAQKHLIEALAIVLNNTNSQFIITTHSPYILSLVNNLLFATRVASRNNAVVGEVEQVIPRIAWLNPEKTNVYFLQNGMCESIFDASQGLIDQNKLDDISEELGADFQALYDIHALAFR